jgi:hypothetical protein
VVKIESFSKSGGLVRELRDEGCEAGILFVAAGGNNDLWISQTRFAW